MDINTITPTGDQRFDNAATSQQRGATPTRSVGLKLIAILGLLGALLTLSEPASAATGTAKLVTPSKFCITVTGYLPMGPYETHGYLNNGARLAIDLYGDDVGLTDDFLGSSGWVTKADGTVNGATLYPSERGIEFEWLRCQHNHWLNEDIIGNDEIYADVTIVDGAGQLLLARKTNTVTGDFGF